MEDPKGMKGKGWKELRSVSQTFKEIDSFSVDLLDFHRKLGSALHVVQELRKTFVLLCYHPYFLDKESEGEEITYLTKGHTASKMW